MAKDTRGLPSNEPVKKDIAAKASASDANIAKIAKDSTPEQVDAANAARLEAFAPSVVNEPKGTVDPVAVKRSRRAGMDPVDGPSTVFVPKGTDPEVVVSKVSKRVNKRRGKSSLVPPVPTQTTPTPGKEKQTAAASVGTAVPKKTTVLDFGKVPSRPASGSSENATSNPDVAENLIDRLKSGMGLPGEEKGTLDLAVKLHAADLATANSTGKKVIDVNPGDAPGTPVSLIGKHHHRFAKVMQTFKISDPEVYRSAASTVNQKLDTYVSGLHKIAQEHEDSKRMVPLETNPGDFWQHPTTGKVIPISENHPDMPASFTRTKQQVAKVVRNTTTGEKEVKRGHQGWDPMKLAGTKARVFRQVTAPTGMDFVDHLRAEMLSEHGPSVVSRKKSAAHAGDIIDQMQSSAPRGMVQTGTEKIAETSPIPKMTSRPRAGRDPKNRRNVRPHGSSKQPADMIYTPNMVTTEVDKPIYRKRRRYTNVTGVAPFPPKPHTGKVLVSPADAPKSPVVSQQFTQPALPGTGVPRVYATEVTPAKYTRVEGPMEERQAAKIGQRASAKSKPWTEEELAPVLRDEKGAKIMAERPVVTTETVPTNREWPRTEIRSQQFAIDTTDMTGAQEVKALSSRGELASQNPVSEDRSLVLRSGGKKKAAADRRASKPPVQLDMFPKFKEDKPKKSEVRSRQFYRPGATQDISEDSKILQGVAERKFGRQPNNKDFETENERSVQDKLELNIQGQPNTSDAIMKQYRAENPKPKKAAKPRKPKK
jgi:hypothetical protein